MNSKSIVSVLSVLLLMLSQQVIAGEAFLKLKEKIKIAGCGSEVENNTGSLFFGGSKKFTALSGSGDFYAGKYKYSSKNRLYKMTFDSSSKKLYANIMADWGEDLCDVNKAKVKNIKYKNFSLKLNKKKTNGKFKFSTSMKGQANGESASVKHTIGGKGPFNKP